jgi:hypothetical protein
LPVNGSPSRIEGHELGHELPSFSGEDSRERPIGGIGKKKLSRPLRQTRNPYYMQGMPPTPRERLDARIRNKEALALRRKACAEVGEIGPPVEPALRAAYDRGRAEAFAELAAVRRREENVAAAARDYVKQNRERREIAAAVRASLVKPLPRVVEAVVVVKALATEVLVAELRRRGIS